MQQQEIRSLTGVRGVAACWIVVYHLHVLRYTTHVNEQGVQDFGLGWWILVHGYLAVDLFFILSGFVMTLAYRELAANGWTLTSFAAFLMRRFARIYPLYVIITFIIVSAGLLGLSKGVYLDAKIIIMNFALVQAWGFDSHATSQMLYFNPPTWSISTEFAAYLLFPFLGLLFVLPWRFACSALFVIVATLFFLQQATSPAIDGFRYGPMDIAWMPSYLPLLRCLSEFALGIITYRLCSEPFARNLAARTGVAWMVVVVLFVLLFFPKADFFIILLIPALLLVLVCGNSAVTRFMASPFVFFLGEISYSIYLMHWQLLRVQRLSFSHLQPYLGDHWSYVMSLLLFYSSVIALSWLSYRIIELPCRRKIRGWEEKWFARQ